MEIVQGHPLCFRAHYASFAATEEPVGCIDFPAPWNPRADGYQSPAGRSSGSGAAIGAYSWLDIAIGSDRSGSGRRPGHWNGRFAMHPTHGSLPHGGYIPSFPRFDCPTFFGRDLDQCKHFAYHCSKRTTILYPIDYINLIQNNDQVAIVDKFVVDLEKSMGVLHEKISFEKVWKNCPPSEAQGLSLYFDAFRADYEERFKKEPYVSPPVRWQWYVIKTQVFRAWFKRQVMKQRDCDTVVIIPIEEISPRYRDELPK
ncbi:amidase signature enzyme [Patellaria atrata CBS 101060]|uniref:Amidase signature enzyme n=1 Tax=Patellaria atrata CBS 101060 TaxID=1346257 RepID=A0A9P4VP22_9PEZI|nr:amidase signature enzyme [Patellaria atrata CBS 101060]